MTTASVMMVVMVVAWRRKRKRYDVGRRRESVVFFSIKEGTGKKERGGMEWEMGNGKWVIWEMDHMDQGGREKGTRERGDTHIHTQG
jgi:hypothetical protein